MPLSSVIGASSILRPGVCTSTTRPASPFEGQTIYETDTDRLATWDGSAWVAYVRQTAGKVLQVVSTTKTDSFSGSLATNSELAITGMSVSITPSATSSRVLVTAMLNAGTFGNYVLKRGSTNICIGDAAGSRDRVTASRASGDPVTVSFSFLDNPATTSATSYSISFVSANTNTVTVYANRSATDTDNGDFARYASTITVMEISG